MLAKAVANHTTAAFIRVVGSEFVQKYLGEVICKNSYHVFLSVLCYGLAWEIELSIKENKVKQVYISAI